MGGTVREVGDPSFGLPNTVARADIHATAVHIARQNPSRVLADVKSKRRIIDLHEITVEKLSVPPYDEMTGDPNPDEYDAYCAVCGYVWVNNDPTQACMTLRLLAEPYADHPDYRPEWRNDRPTT